MLILFYNLLVVETFQQLVGLNFTAKKLTKYDKITLCEQEFKVKWQHVFPEQRDGVAKPKIMGFDIEVNSTNPSAMPKAEKNG